MSIRTNGISVIVCCYNSSQRIVATLEHLVAQEFSGRVDWEIILVDNNSSDDTAETAKQFMNSQSIQIPFSVVLEKSPGLSNARNKGFSESRYEIALMVDDDNSLAPNYVEGIFRAFEGKTNIGMAGGLGVAALDTNAPKWFDRHASAFAVGRQQTDPNVNVEHLYGAGLALRLDALERIRKVGFKSLLSDRTGSNLMSGGDTELCFAFRMAGYDLKYIPELTFQHHLPANRINWKYLRRLYSGFGQSKAYMEAYTAAISEKPIPNEGRFPFWVDRARFLFVGLIPDLPLLLIAKFKSLEGNDRLLSALAKQGHLKKILSLKDGYFKNYQLVYSLYSSLKELRKPQ